MAENKKIITIISGGPKPESEISRLCANDIKSVLDKNKYEVHEVTINEKGQWKRGEYIKSPKKALEGTDVVINALFGKFGELGIIQNILDSLGYPHTSSKGFASGLAADKLATKHIFEQSRINTPQTFAFEYKKILDFKAVEREILSRFNMPFIIKPNTHTPSIGVSIVKQIGDIAPAIREAAKFDKTVLAQEYLRGVHMISGVVETKSGLIGLPPLMVVSRDEVFNVRNEFDPIISKRVTIASFGENLINQMKVLAVLAHKLLGLRYYSRIDFLVVKETIYIFNVHSLPGLSKHSLMVRALGEWGLNFGSFIEHLVDLALSEKNATFERAYNRVNVV